MTELDEVYEKFKHLDNVFSDTEWCRQGSAIYGIAGELWRAIKQERERQQATPRPFGMVGARGDASASPAGSVRKTTGRKPK